MNKIWIWVLVVVVVLGGAWYLLHNKSTAPVDTDNDGDVAAEANEIPATQADETTPASAKTPNTSTSNVKEFAVSASNFSFDVKNIKVKKGDTVRIVFTNKEGFHDFVIDEFKARTKQIKAPGTETIEFVADKAGSFEYYCSVGTHRQMGMKGTLVVE